MNELVTPFNQIIILIIFFGGSFLLDSFHSFHILSSLQNADLRKQLKTLQTELEQAIERREAAITTETTAKNDAREQQQRASEAQDK